MILLLVTDVDVDISIAAVGVNGDVLNLLLFLIQSSLSFADKDRLRSAVVRDAEIVGSTLGFSGSSLFDKLSCKFDIVVIDEAAQAVEPTSLVPLIRGCKQVSM